MYSKPLKAVAIIINQIIKISLLSSGYHFYVWQAKDFIKCCFKKGGNHSTVMHNISQVAFRWKKEKKNRENFWLLIYTVNILS